MRALVLLTSIVVGACAQPASIPTPRSPTAEVLIDDYTFTPQMIEVTVGTRVRWVNKDQLTHTVTNSPSAEVPLKPDRTYDLDVARFNLTLDGGTEAVLDFSARGTYYYYCLPYNWMRGVVVVR